MYQNGWQNMEPFHFFLFGLLPANSNLIFNLPTWDIFTGIPLTRQVFPDLYLYKDTKFSLSKGKAELSPAGLNALSLAGIKYVLSPFILENNKLQLVREYPSDMLDIPSIKIYENKSFSPRFYLASHGQKIETLEQFHDFSQQPNVNWGEIVLLEENPQEIKNQRGEIKLEVETETYLRFLVLYSNN